MSGSKPPESEKIPRRLRLLDHLGDGAFSSDSLQDTSAKIARLSRQHDESDTQASLIPLGEITDSLTDSDTDWITDSTSTSPNESPIQTPIGSPIDESVISPNGSPEGTPETSPNESPIHSPNGSPNGKSLGVEDSKLSWEPVLLTENQATLYICLKQISGAVTSLNLISQATRISEHTLKSALKKLREHGLIIYGGRKNSGGRFGFTAEAVERPIVLRGERTRVQERLRQIDTQDIIFAASLSGIEVGKEGLVKDENQLELELSHLMNHRFNHRFNNSPLSSSSFKNKELLQDLQKDLILENHMNGLDIRSLEPYLDRFDSSEDWQNFLDKVNATVDDKIHSPKPIQNPLGFMFACLKEGHINPPSGFKTRRVRIREAQISEKQAELAELRKLEEQEAELDFELFCKRLSDDERAQVEAEAATRVKPKSPVSRELQIQGFRVEILQERFKHSKTTS